MPETAHRGDPKIASAARRHNVLVRHRGRDDPRTIAARRDLKAVSAESYIQRLVDTFPPLTPEQLAELAAILNSAGEPDLNATGLLDAGEA